MIQLAQERAVSSVQTVVIDQDGERGVIAAFDPVSYTHLRAHETVLDLVCRLLLENKNSYNTEGPMSH